MTQTTLNKEELIAPFERKNKYIVIKLSRLNDNPTIRNQQLADLNRYSDAFVESVVVESDKREYEAVWQMVQDRIQGKATLIESKLSDAKPVEQLVAVPSGWKLVPIEPNFDMKQTVLEWIGL